MQIHVSVFKVTFSSFLFQRLRTNVEHILETDLNIKS